MRRQATGSVSPSTPILGYGSDRSSPLSSTAPQVVLPPLKVIVVGDPSVGKTAFIASHAEAAVGVREKDIGTHKVRITTVAYASSKGSCQFDLWDLPPSQPPHTYGPTTLPTEFLKSAKCAVVVYDVTNPKSYSSIFGWRQALLGASSNMPMVLCANKVDSPARQEELMLASVPGFGQHGFAKAFLISSQEAANTVRPMAWLAREAYHDDDFHFIGPPDPADENTA